MRTSTRGGRRLAPALLALLAAAPAAAAVDPFYLARLQDGIAAYERKAYADAAQSFRFACFGMLDEEPQLADCLARLALAQAGAGDRDGFSQTFRRLLEAEETVGLYSETKLAPEIRAPFEARIVEWIPRAVLGTSEAFQRLAADQRETQLASLEPKARRARLAQLEKDEPKIARWPLLAARFEKEQKEPRAVLAAAERALRLDSNLAEARCLRGWARAETGKFTSAAEDLAGCPTSDPAFAVAELRSRVELGQWGEAESLLAAIPAGQRGAPAVTALAKRVEKEAGRRPTPKPAPSASESRTPAEAPVVTGTNGKPAPPPAHPAPATPSAAAPAGAAAPAPPPAPARAGTEGGPIGGALSAADETELGRVQSQLVRARTAADIEQTYGAAAALAARHPAHPRVQHTAAEIAYRASRWADAVRHFRQGGDPSEAQPLLLFYLAVSLWEAGARQEAAAVMRRCDGKLRSTPFVEGYRNKILGSPPGS